MTKTEQYRVERDRQLDLSFTGKLVGEGSYGTGGEYRCNWTRGTDVNIYITNKGSIVTAVCQWSRWQGENNSHRAAIHNTIENALDWLIKDSSGYSSNDPESYLGHASKEAWEDACTNASEFFGASDVIEVA